MKFSCISGCFLLFVPSTLLLAQTPVVVKAPVTTLFFLTLAPDARSAALGEAGVALSADANATYWNASKLAFADRDFGASATYTPWLTSLTDHMWLGYASVYKKLGKRQALAGSVNYFTDANHFAGKSTTSDVSVNLTYSRQLGKNFSAGLTMKYISSQIDGSSFTPNTSLRTGKVVAADLSIFYKKQVLAEENGKNLTYTFGAVLSNIGPKMKYGPASASSYIPTMLKAGGGISYSPNDKNRFNFILDASKFLIPFGNYPFYPTNQPALQGILKSFSDSDDGLKGELREVSLSFGAEYWYKSAFALRGGYHTEDKTVGDRKFLTAGAGLLLFKNYGADFSYLIPVKEGSPLAHTMRISLSAYFGKN